MKTWYCIVLGIALLVYLRVAFEMIAMLIRDSFYGIELFILLGGALVLAGIFIPWGMLVYR